MENELIKLISKDNGEITVSARDLHEGLELRKHFTDWIKPYIKSENEYGFEENVDFTRIHSGVNPTNGVPIIDYEITLDTAKELAMLSKSAKGKEMRKYFIKAEKQLKNNQLAVQNNKIEKLTNELTELKNEYSEQLKDFNESIERAKRQFKPSHKRKLDYNKMIKAATSTDEEAQIVKDWTLSVLNVDKWEDTSTEDSKKILETITTVSTLLNLNKIKQLSLFDINEKLNGKEKDQGM